MKKEDLIEVLKKHLGKDKVIEISKWMDETGFDVKELLDLTFHPNTQVAFRAAWILENYYVGNPVNLSAQLPLFLEKIKLLKNHSVQRHYAKILARMTNKNAPISIKESLEQLPTETVVEEVFNWLISETVPVAIKAHCITILANLTRKHNWIREELIQTMDFLVDKESVAFYGRVKQIRKQLGKSEV